MFIKRRPLCYSKSLQFLTLLSSDFLHAGRISLLGSVQPSSETVLNIKTCASFPSQRGRNSFLSLKSTKTPGISSTLYLNLKPFALLVRISKFSILRTGEGALWTSSKSKGHPLSRSVPVSTHPLPSLFPKRRANLRMFASMPY